MTLADRTAWLLPIAPARRGALALILGLGAALSAYPQRVPGSTTIAAETLVRDALSSNPKLKAQEQRIEAARQRVPQAAALPDPMADLRFTNISLSDPNLHDALTTGLELGVEQTLPGPGKRKLARSVAEGEVATEEARYVALQRDLRRDVLQSAFQFGLLQRLLDLNRETADAQRVVVEASLASYSAGLGSQSDVLLAQSALTRVQADRADLESQREIARARLSNLLARPVRDGELGGLLPAADPSTPPPLDAQLALLAEGSAEVLRARAESAVANQRVEVAKRASGPDFLVGGAYRYKDMTMGGKNYLTATVGITLPFFHKSDRYLPAQNEALALQRGAFEEERSTLEDARYELSEAHRRAARDAELFRLYRDGLVEQASQTYAAALAAYTTGKSDMTTVLDALSKLYGDQAQMAMTRAEYFQSLAAIEALTGRPVYEPAAPTSLPTNATQNPSNSKE